MLIVAPFLIERVKNRAILENLSFQGDSFFFPMKNENKEQLLSK